jgi:hypothetical protein
MPVENITCQDNPFDPDNHAAYMAWRTHKLEGYPQRAEELIVEINDPPVAGPVFSIDTDGCLHMRYTARAHNIEWKNDAATRAAVSALETLLASEDPFIYRLTLQPGWGLVSNNVLHDRSGFNDDPDHPRLLYRLRYFEHVTACHD